MFLTKWIQIHSFQSYIFVFPFQNDLQVILPFGIRLKCLTNPICHYTNYLIDLDLKSTLV